MSSLQKQGSPTVRVGIGIIFGDPRFRRDDFDYRYRLGCGLPFRVILYFSAKAVCMAIMFS